MSVELVSKTSPRIEPDLQIAILFSLLGLTLTLVLLPFLGNDFGTWLALAG